MAIGDVPRRLDADVRLLDYLDDKLQSLADFETLDSLLESVQAQQDILKQQLSDARSEHTKAEAAAHEHASWMQEKSQAFQQTQDDIDRRLLIVTQSETSDDAIARFEDSMDKLRRLDTAYAYADMLKELESLGKECTSQLGTSDKTALESYSRLRGLVTGLKPLHEEAEGAAPHLMDHVAKMAQSVKGHIQKSFAADFEKTLAKIGWPRPGIVVLPPDVEQEWRVGVGKLLDLQKSELIAEDDINKTKASKDEPAVLLPLELMVKPLELRFNYHFSGDRPTNRLDKPEYFLAHVLDLLNSYSTFFQNALQPLLTTHFRNTELASTPAYIDATSALISAVLPMLQRKLVSVLPQVASQPQLLSNLVHEIMSFDTTIQEEWAYTPLAPSMPWRGLSHFILEKQSFFARWLAVERDFALARYEAIMNDRSSGELDYDSAPPGTSKPTKAAIRVNDLLETVTDRYRNLSSFSQKLRFLIDIQIAIFDRFHNRLHESLEAFLTRTTAVARAVHGVSRDDQTELAGVKGLDRLCRVFGSSEYLEKAMRDWSDDVFFLELWEELQYRVSAKVPIKGDVQMQDIAAKTSAAIGAGAQDESLQGALFDETAASYQRLRVRSEAIIVDTVSYNIRDALRPYTRINTWASLSSTSASNDAAAAAAAALTAELDTPLRLLDSYLAFLARALAKAPLRRVGRSLGHAVQTTLWDSVMMRHSFSTPGARQFVSDVQGIWSIFDRYIGNGAGRVAMRRLSEGLTLLGLPVRGEIPEEVTEGDGGSDVKKWSLFEVERRVFIDNEAARDVLEEMGLEVLTESDARAVLERRVELAS